MAPTCKKGRARGVPWAAMCVLFVQGFAVSASAQTAELGLPESLTTPCSLDRDPLRVTVLASAPGIYPELAVRTDDGWLVYDEYRREVVELGPHLKERRVIGRHGPGPLEYELPRAVWKTQAGDVIVVDRGPPSLLIFRDGGTKGEERRLVGLDPYHAVPDGDGGLYLSDKRGHVFLLDDMHSGSLEPQVAWPSTSMDINDPLPRDAASPQGLLRPAPVGEGTLLVGLRGPSHIWELRSGARSPKRRVARCVPEKLADVHTVAPRVNIPPWGNAKFSVETLMDFVALSDGRILAIGGMELPDGGRSIELYDAGGDLIRAWSLELPEVHGVMDAHNPGTLLIWSEEIYGTQLVEVSGEDFPTRY